MRRNKFRWIWALLLALTAMSAHAWDGSGTATDPYRVSTTADWQQLATDVNAGNSYSGKYFRMTADINTDGAQIGTAGKPFSGVFDGDGHVLTYNKGTYSTQSIVGIDEACAPFGSLNGATIRHLSTTGIVVSENLYNGGIAVYIDGAGDTKGTTLYNCRSDIEFWLTYDGDVVTGGLVGEVKNNVTVAPTFEKCVFTGQFNSYGKRYSGLVGLSNVSGVKFKECMVDVPNARVNISGGTFVRMADGLSAQIDDCYCTRFFAEKQGTCVFSTISVPAGCTYKMVEEPDLQFGGKSYWKSGAHVNLTMSEGTAFNHWADSYYPGVFVSNPFRMNGIHQLQDVTGPISLHVETAGIPTAETERTEWGVTYRYLSRKDYHYFVSDETCQAKGWRFESDANDANLVVYDANNNASEITAITGYDESDYNEDGVQIHNDLVSNTQAHTHLGLIAPRAFANSNALKTLYFKDTDAALYNALLPFDFMIGDEAFKDCPNLTEVKMMQYTTEGDNHWTALTPSQVTSIGNDVFSGSPNAMISVDATQYQSYLSSSTWKPVNNRLKVYNHTNADITLYGAVYSYMRNTAGDPLKNNAQGHADIMNTIRLWNADYQQFNATSLLAEQDKENIWYTQITGVDDSYLTNAANNGVMRIYNDPGTYYNYKTLALTKDAIAGNENVKAIEFWQTNGNSQNSYTDLKMVIQNGALKNCKNLEELRLFYHVQDGDDRWIALGPKDVIPGNNIFGLATITADDVTNGNIDYESMPSVPKNFRIIVASELYPEFMDDPNWKPYMAFVEPVDYSPAEKADFTEGGLTYSYMTSPGGIMQASQVVSQDVSWWTAPRIAIEVALAAATLGTYFGSTEDAALKAAYDAAYDVYNQAEQKVAEATGLKQFIESTAQKLTAAVAHKSPEEMATAIGSLYGRKAAEFGMDLGAVNNIPFFTARGILDSRGVFSHTAEGLLNAFAGNKNMIVSLGYILKSDFSVGATNFIAQDIAAKEAVQESAKKAFQAASEKWLTNHVAHILYNNNALLRKAITPLSVATSTAAYISSQCWGGSGSYDADAMNKGMRENILANIHQVGLVGGGYVITTPQKNLVYHTYIKSVSDATTDAVIYAGFDNDGNVNTSNRTMTVLPGAFQNKTNLQTVKFHDISNQSSNTGMAFLFTIPDEAFKGCTALTTFSTLLQTNDNGTRALGPENFILGGDNIFADLDPETFHIVIDLQRKDDFLASESWKPLEKYFTYESAQPAAKFSEYGAKYAYAYEMNSIKKENKVQGHLIEHTLVVGPDDDFITAHQGAVKLCNDIGTYNNYQLDAVNTEAFKDNQNVRSVSFVDLYGFGAFGDSYTDLQVHLGDRAFQGCSNLANLDLLYMVTDGINHIVPMTPQMVSIGEDVFKDSPAQLKMMPQQVAWFEADDSWSAYKDRFMPCVIRFTDPGIKEALKDMAYYDPANTGSDPSSWDDYCDYARIAGAGFSWLDGKFTAQKDNIKSFADFKHFESVGLTYIGASWFDGCSQMGNIVLPSTIKTIGDNAFNNCSALQEMELPQAVNTIGANAFAGCTSLNTITVRSSVPATLGANAFDKHDGLQIYVPTDKVAEYKTAWSDYASYIVGDDTYQINKVVTVTAVGQLATKLSLTLHKEYNKVRYITGPYAKYDSLTVIGPLNGEDLAVLRYLAGADAYRSAVAHKDDGILNLWDAQLKKDLENSYNGNWSNEFISNDDMVPYYLFENCTALETVILPKSATLIGENLFEDASALKRVCVGRSTTTYECDLLQNLNGIEELVFLTNTPATSTSDDPWEAPIQQVYTLPSQLGDYLGDPGLTQQAQDITSPFTNDNVMWALAEKGHFFPSEYLALESADGIFTDNTTIKDLGDFYQFHNVKTLGNTFSGMSSLESVTLPSSVEEISALAFSDCQSLQTIHVSSIKTEEVTVGSETQTQLIPPTLAQDSFKDLPNDFQILVPKEYCKLYREKWAQYADHINPDNATYSDEEIITVTLTEANTLAEKLGLTMTIKDGYSGSRYVGGLKGDYSKVHKLKVIGPISGGDLDVMRYLAGYCPWASTRNYSGRLEYIDLYDANLVESNVQVAGYTRSATSLLMAEDFTLFPVETNVLPQHAFLRAYSLKNLILPRTCTKVYSRALQECEGLEVLTLGDDMTDFNWNALDDDAMLTRMYILAKQKVNISTEWAVWRLLCNNYNPTFDAFYVRPSLYNDYLMDDAYTGSSWQRTNNVSKGAFDDDESFCAFAAHGAATQDDLFNVSDVSGWFTNHTDIINLTPLGFTTISSLSANDIQPLTKLETIVLPASLTTIDKDVFAQASNLRYVDMLMCANDMVSDIKTRGLADLGIDTQQTLVYLPATYGESDGTNIVVSDGTTLSAKKFRLVDGIDYCVPYAFETADIENSRSIANANRTYTVCLPYELDVPEGAKAYQLSGRNGAELVFSEVTGKMEAMKPYIVKTSATTANLNTTIKQMIPANGGSTFGQQTDIAGYTLRGTFEKISNKEAHEMGAYLMQSDNRWYHAPENVENAYIPAFRCYLLENGGQGGARTLTMMFVDDTTGIETIRTVDSNGEENTYDLSGRRVRTNARGIVIKNSKAVFVK